MIDDGFNEFRYGLDGFRENKINLYGLENIDLIKSTIEYQKIKFGYSKRNITMLNKGQIS